MIEENGRGPNFCDERSLSSCEQDKSLENKPKANNKTRSYVVHTDKRVVSGMNMFHPKYPVSLPKDMLEAERGSAELRSDGQKKELGEMRTTTTH